MNMLRKVGNAFSVGVKAFKDMRFPGLSYIFFDFDKPALNDIAKEIGDGTSSDIVMTPVRWLQRAMQESSLAVFLDDEIVPDHDLVDLINTPNPFYSADTLIAGTVFSLSTAGNAYWIKVTNDNGRVAELWWVPASLVEPKWEDGSDVFIDHYLYTVSGKQEKLKPEDVVHFRDGVDPANMRKGLSPLRGLLREIWTDNEAAIFTASLMKNGGVPGLLISPADPAATITLEEAEQAKAMLDEQTTRNNRGKPIVMTGPTKLEQFGFNPRQMDLSPLRNVSEERVTAALGVPAAVIGFGAGLDSTKVGATMKELRQMAWHNGVMPLQRVIARTLQKQLLPDFKGDGTVAFDNSNVAALAEDEDKHVERVSKLVTASIWTRAEGRKDTGQEVSPGDDVYLMPFNVIAVPQGALPNSDDEPKKHQRALHKQHSLLEESIARRPSRIPPAILERFGKAIDNIRTTLPTAMETELMTFFASFGAAALRAATEVLEETRSDERVERKTETLDAARIAEGMNLLGQETAFKQLFERHYLRVGTEAGDLLADFFSVEVGLPDAAARAMIATGGRRAGLLDLSAKTRRKLFERLVEGRIEGRAGDSLARFIRDGVEAGPWSTPAIRAKVIARTETAFATNVATVEASRSITGVESMMVLDARAGSTDEVCERLNGTIVTIDEARQLSEDEHPNGTRGFVPITSQLAEELSQ